MGLVYQYDKVYESWVFATEEEIQKREDFESAFFSDTWGEFRKKLPKEYRYAPEIEKLEIDEMDGFITDPPDDEPFKYKDWLERIYYWPEFYIFFSPLPESIIRKYGEMHITMHDGEYYQFEKHKIDDIVEELKKLGIEAEHREDLPIACDW